MRVINITSRARIAPQRLGHAYPEWVDDPSEQPHEVFVGRMRIVHTQRARKLRKRGVPLMLIGRGQYAWFETHESYDARVLVRRVRAQQIGDQQ